eukprot:scaffold607125_cov32-Prasinocladus_malaysianus.AAC.1
MISAFPTPASCKPVHVSSAEAWHPISCCGVILRGDRDGPIILSADDLIIWCFRAVSSGWGSIAMSVVSHSSLDDEWTDCGLALDREITAADSYKQICVDDLMNEHLCNLYSNVVAWKGVVSSVALEPHLGRIGMIGDDEPKDLKRASIREVSEIDVVVRLPQVHIIRGPRADDE